MSFHVGQRIECIDPKAIYFFPRGGELKRSAIYTVRDVGITVAGGPGVRLYEAILTSGPGQIGIITGKPCVDAFYRASRFRPVVERQTDISIFTDMLIPHREKV